MLISEWMREAVDVASRRRMGPEKPLRFGLRDLALFVMAGCFCMPTNAQAQRELKLHIAVGHRAEKRMPFYVHMVPSGGVKISGPDTWQATAGAGHVETATYSIVYPDVEIKPIPDMQVIWAYLLSHSDNDTRERLMHDPAARPDARRLTFQFNADGTRGFTLTMDQLTHEKSFWIPALDVYLSTGDSPESFAESHKELATRANDRVLDAVERGPEASYGEFKAKWEDMGNPAYVHPAQEGPGHIICVSWDSAIPKFGIDRGAGVWNDYGNPDRFRFWFGFGDLSDGIVPYWKGQRLQDGLPIITTTFERDGIRYEVEQFAYPLNGPPAERKGELNMVLLQRVRLTDISGVPRTVPVALMHERLLPSGDNASIHTEQVGGRTLFEAAAKNDAILAVDPEGASIQWAGVTPRDEEFRRAPKSGQALKRIDVTLAVPLTAHGTREFTVALPSPMVSGDEREALAQLSYNTAREQTLDFWNRYLARGAQFESPEKAVNDMFRANLWHALVLPRRHDNGQIDLPYSNFAYSQTGTPWPVNQAVYVDYMLYGLRGYNPIATEELEAIFRNNQGPDGHLGGNANWLVYTPGMLYAVAENYLLSNDRESFEKLLPETLRSLDWSIDKIRKAETEQGTTSGLVTGELNDLTGSGDWAFNQAYLYAGVEAMGKALERDGNPRAAECLKIAAEYRSRIEHAMSVAMVASPLVELRDHSWSPYVPSNASDPGRNFHQWYPSDVDTGAVHLLRLGALPAEGELADSLLNDEEDNLYLNAWGAANEPVYNPQATAYLLRDDAKAVIRAFYSMMACGFSQSVFEPVEHRWRWGQYFGPPSTDGAWFELYRNMLVREMDDHTLILGQAAPRAWLQDGKVISVQNAPTWFGRISFRVQSHAKDGRIDAAVHLDDGLPRTTILLRLRHPDGRQIHGVTVNGKEWRDFDAQKEWIRIPNAGSGAYTVVANY
ncbi:MAG TPA: hypothetical protein VGS10_10385 [Terracidiphilus sp.]|nr:hypothetical protein [Terracidiphilus sp.]